ncbi:MAG TPA: hypothetical protein VGI33_18245 [Paenibacillus sp.]|jgi:hypothetical protein
MKVMCAYSLYITFKDEVDTIIDLIVFILYTMFIKLNILNVDEEY